MFRGKDDAKLGRKPGMLRLRLKPNESVNSEFFYRGKFLFDKSSQHKFVSPRCVIFQCCCKQQAKWKIDKMNPKQRRNKKQQLIDLYGSDCWWCRQNLPQENLTFDHLLPKSRGGSNSFENLRLSCFPCNNSRGNSLYPPSGKKLNYF